MPTVHPVLSHVFSFQANVASSHMKEEEPNLCFIPVGNWHGAHALDNLRSFMGTLLLRSFMLTVPISECGDRALVNPREAVDNQCTIAPVKSAKPRPGPFEFRKPATFKVHSEVCWQVPLLQLVPVMQFCRSALE